MANFVKVRNSEGHEKTWSRNTYNLLPKRMKAEWRIVGEAKGPSAPEKSAGMTTSAASFLPPEIEEAKRAQAEAAERSKESELISGAAAEALPAPAPAPAETAAPAANDEAQESADGKELLVLANMGAKCAEVLAKAGVGTLAKLIDTPNPEINRILEAANFLPKKAQVPGWKLKAAELIKSQATA